MFLTSCWKATMCLALLLTSGQFAMAKQSAYNPENGHVYTWFNDANTDRLSWSDARRQVASSPIAGVTGHLATIADAAEQTFLTERFQNLTGWIGGYQTPGAREPAEGFRWVTGEALSYTNWSPGEPNNIGANNENVVGIVPGGRWQDAPDIPGYLGVYVAEYEVKPLDIIRNSVSIVSTENGGIEAHFQPNFSLSLADAASALGVDGFNWVQTVTPPTSVTPWRLAFPDRIQPAFDSIFLDDGGPYYFRDGLDDKRYATQLSEPLIDPIVGGETAMYLYVSTDNDGNQAFSMIDHYEADREDFYFNANQVSGAGGIPLEEMFLDSKTLRFFDAPSLSAVGMEGLDVTSLFHTELVGVKNGEPVFFGNQLGTAFSWKSDRRHDGFGGVHGVTYLSTLTAPPATGGGVFGVKVDRAIVPEPGALGLVTSALAVVLLSRRAIHERDRSA